VKICQPIVYFPAMKKKLYIETSVWNQLEHTDRPEWRETAELFIKTVKDGHYEAYISNVVIDEILATPDQQHQNKLAQHINRVQPLLLEMDEEAEMLAKEYITAGFRGSSSVGIYRDCSHVALATLNGIRHIVNFYCNHLVNDRKIDSFNAVNIRNGYDLIVDITTPHKFLPIPEQEQSL